MKLSPLAELVFLCRGKGRGQAKIKEIKETIGQMMISDIEKNTERKEEREQQ